MSAIYLSENNLSFFAKDYQFKMKSLQRTNWTHESFTDNIELKFTDDGKMSESKLKNLIWKNLARECHCQHDCCGHYFTSHFDINRKSRTKFFVKIHHSRNI